MWKSLFIAGAIVAAAATAAPPTETQAAALTGVRDALTKPEGLTLAGYRRHGGRHVYHVPRHRYVPRHYSYVQPRVFLYSVPAVTYGYRSSGYSHCSWLRDKARSTSDRYWWRRYKNEC